MGHTVYDLSQITQAIVTTKLWRIMTYSSLPYHEFSVATLTNTALRKKQSKTIRDPCTQDPSVMPKTFAPYLRQGLHKIG